MTTQMKFGLAGACALVAAAAIVVWSEAATTPMSPTETIMNHNSPPPVENWEPGICKPHCRRLRAAWGGDVLSQILAFLVRWQAARRDARKRRIQQIIRQGLSAIDWLGAQARGRWHQPDL